MMKIIRADWPAPANVNLITTTRHEGFSQPPFQSNNLALHVGDQPEAVLKNREQLKQELKLTQEPFWLNQTHSHRCVEASDSTDRNADASFTRRPKQPLAIMTADCLPIALSNQEGNEIAMIHAGWKGLLDQVIENTLSQLQSKSEQLLAWIGPAICRDCFEVGDEVYQAFHSAYPYVQKAFQPVAKGKWLADLALMAELILNKNGIKAVFQSEICTFELKNDYYSYRREGQTGRMVTLIWFNDQHQEI